MESILRTQQLLFSLSPGLVPLAAWLYSALSSWHCSAMCGGLTIGIAPRQMNSFLVTRIVAYTTMGGVMGFGGRLLREALEFQVINVFAFVIFLCLTLLCVLPNLIPGLARFSLSWRAPRFLRARLTSPLTTALLAFTPCHLLTFYYGLAASLGSVGLGAILLFGHAVMTTPALAYTKFLEGRLKQVSPRVRQGVRILVLVLILFNAAYFIGRLMYSEDEAQKHILFCL